MGSPNLPRDTRVEIALVDRPLLTPRKICAGVNTVYSRAENVFFLEHYFASKSKQLKIGVRRAESQKRIVGRLFFWGNNLRGTVSESSDLIHFFVLKQMKGITCFNVMGRWPILRTRLLLYCRSSVVRAFWAWSLATAISRLLTPPDFFLWGCLKERLYLNNPRSLEELKHNIEQTDANTDPEILYKLPRNTLKRVDASPWEGGGHFQHPL
jgi:hypothetical protein